MCNTYTTRVDDDTARDSKTVSRRRALGSLAAVGSLAIGGCSSLPRLSGVKPLWSRTFPEASETSPPAVAANHVLVGAQDKAFYGLDPDSGDTRFRYETGGPIEVAPATAGAGGPYYVYSTDGDIYAVDAGGQLRWHKEGQHKRGAVATNGSLLAQFDPDTNTVYGFDGQSGDRRFEQPIGGPQLAGLTEERLVFREKMPENQTRLVALSTSDGNARWRTDAKRQYPRFAVDEQLVVSARHSLLCAYDTRTGRRNWQSTLDDTGSYKSVMLGPQVYLHGNRDTAADEILACDRQTGSVVWNNSVGYLIRHVEPTPNGLFVGSLVEDPDGGILGRVDCFELDGTRRWQRVTKAHDVEGLCVTGDLAVVSDGRRLVALDRDSGEHQWSYRSHSHSRLRLAVSTEQLYVSFLDDGAVARFPTKRR